MPKSQFLLIFSLAIVLLLRLFYVVANSNFYKTGDTINFITTLSSDPKTISGSQLISVVLPTGQRIFTRVYGANSFEYGNKIRISGSVKTKEIERTSNRLAQVLQ